MEFQSYNAELGIANLMFQKLFNNIRIERTDTKTNKKYQVKVGCVFGQVSRIKKALQNPERRGNYSLPLIIINRSGYSRQGERLNNLNNEVKYELTPARRLYELMAPIPIDITYDVTIVAKYPQDLDKIASNFMVFFNSDLFVSFEHPKYQGLKVDCQVIMSDSATEENLDEIDGGQDDLVSSQFSFTFATQLFAGTTQAKLIHPKQVSSYTSSFISSVLTEIAPEDIDQFQEDNPDKSVCAIFDLSPDEIDAFQKANPTRSVSAMIDTEMTAVVDQYVDDISSEMYDNVPIIYNLDFGFYNVPSSTTDILAYTVSVDEEKFTEHVDTDLSGELSNGYYEVVDYRCSLEPYVDKIYWGIDATVNDKFPNNVAILKRQ